MAWFRRKEVERAAAVGLCCMHICMCSHQCAVFVKEKMSSVMHLIASNIC